MGVVVRHPGILVTGYFVVSLVPVKVNLERLDAPLLFHHMREAENVFELGVFFDDDDAFPDRAGPLPGAHLAALDGVLDLLLLQGASGLLLDHYPDGFEVLLQGAAIHFRRDIGGVVFGQVETDVECVGVELLDVLWVPPVV